MSEDQTQYQLHDRLSFVRVEPRGPPDFVDLALHEPVPDAIA